MLVLLSGDAEPMPPIFRWLTPSPAADTKAAASEGRLIDIESKSADRIMGYTAEDVARARRTVFDTIGRCERAQAKFAEGSSQRTLLKNRIGALRLSAKLMEAPNECYEISRDELADALVRISSIISKCEKARSHFIEEPLRHSRLSSLIEAMCIAGALISEQVYKLA